MNEKNIIDTDYLVIGAGAMGMAFADVLVSETSATVTLIDKHDRPGGHWNDAYPFVRLHQPSAFYGVNSRRLGSNVKDKRGGNKGLFELASGAEVCTYFDQIMQRGLLASGRVQYFPMSEYVGENTFRSLVNGTATQVQVARKTVDATYMNVQVPSTRGPLYDVDPTVRCVPLNDLPRVSSADDNYVVIGAGKTGIDACLWLLKHGVAQSRIRWVMPRDSWYLNRKNIQPGMSFINDTYRCATVTESELDALRGIEQVIRMGRVKSIGNTEITLEGGTVPTNQGTLHIDCSADGLANRPAVPVFDGNAITLQSIRTCQQVFSAATLARIEHSYPDDKQKNALATPVPHPNTDVDWLRSLLISTQNGVAWSQEPELQAWLAQSRLNFGSHFVPKTAKEKQAYGATVQDLARRNAELALPGIAKLKQLLALEEQV